MHYLIILFLTMSFGDIIFQHSSDNKKIVRNIERLNKKITNAKLSVLFNQTCISNNLLPSYTNIYIYIYILSRQSAVVAGAVSL